jgi:hypothetical protein
MAIYVPRRGASCDFFLFMATHLWHKAAIACLMVSLGCSFAVRDFSDFARDMTYGRASLVDRVLTRVS